MDHRKCDGLVLLYDERCALCQRSVQTLGRLKLAVPLTMLPLQRADLSSLASGLTREQLMAELHVITRGGEVFRGADAVFRILQEVPSLRWISMIGRIPGLHGASRTVYRWIARHRYRLFGTAEDCTDGTCSIHRVPK